MPITLIETNVNARTPPSCFDISRSTSSRALTTSLSLLPITRLHSTPAHAPDSHHSHIMGKKVAVKLPAANDPDWRKYYAEQNEKLKQSHPGSTGAYRRRVIQRAWRKEHEPANQETASSKKSAQGKKGARKATSDESGSD